jgi:hypothetical protein
MDETCVTHGKNGYKILVVKSFEETSWKTYAHMKGYYDMTPERRNSGARAEVHC